MFIAGQFLCLLTLSWRRLLSYRNQSIDLQITVGVAQVWKIDQSFVKWIFQGSRLITCFFIFSEVVIRWCSFSTITHLQWSHIKLLPRPVYLYWDRSPWLTFFYELSPKIFSKNFQNSCSAKHMRMTAFIFRVSWRVQALPGQDILGMSWNCLVSKRNFLKYLQDICM